MGQPVGPGQVPRDEQRQKRSFRLVEWIAAAVGFAVGAVIPGQPQTARDWIIVAAGALVAVFLVELSRLSELSLSWPGGWFRRHRKSAVTLATTIILFLAVLIGFGATQLREQVEGIWIWASGCPQQTELRLLSSPDELDTARLLADKYEQWTANENHGCPTAHVHTYSAPARKTLRALTAGWSVEYLRDVGPQPDMWFTEWGDGFDDLAQKLTGPNATGITITEHRSVASSPLVLGVARSVTDDAPDDVYDAYEQREEQSWASLLRQYPQVVRPDPHTEPMGEVATAVLYGYGAGEPVTRETARELELQIGRSLDEDSYPLGSSLQLLCRHRMLTMESPSPPRSAALISEQALVRFNTSKPLGGPCATAQDPQTRDTFLAFYPPETRSLDYQFVQFSSYPRQEKEAEKFGRWLTDDDGKNALVDAALRPPGFPVREPLSEENGIIPGAMRDPIRTDALSNAMQVYQDVQRPGRVLLALDSSGSMNEPAAGGQSRLEIAKAGVLSALRLMRGQDELGLRFFPGGEAVPIRPRNQEAITAALEQIPLTDHTPLFRTIVDGVSAVNRDNPGDDVVRALVVLTDGQDTEGLYTPDAVSAAAQDNDVRVYVIAVGETECTKALQEMAAATGGECQEAGFNSVQDKMAEVFGALWGEPD